MVAILTAFILAQETYNLVWATPSNSTPTVSNGALAGWHVKTALWIQDAIFGKSLCKKSYLLLKLYIIDS